MDKGRFWRSEGYVSVKLSQYPCGVAQAIRQAKTRQGAQQYSFTITRAKVSVISHWMNFDFVGSKTGE